MSDSATRETDLLVRPASPPRNGTVTRVTPESAGWTYVGFEVIQLRPEQEGSGASQSISRNTGDTEVCVVVVEGTWSVHSVHGDWADLGRKAAPSEAGGRAASEAGGGAASEAGGGAASDAGGGAPSEAGGGAAYEPGAGAASEAGGGAASEAGGGTTSEAGGGAASEAGRRRAPFAGRPDAAYLPPDTEFELRGSGEVALCSAPAPSGGAAGRVLPGDEIEVETRGFGAQERTVVPILMGDREAESLLVCEVLTPPGHWSSYPPHKHDRDALPHESYLEETYYHRIDPPRGFALQRVYTGDGNLDETVAVRDRDVVLVPRGYHTVSAPPGYAVYYLNVMAGPERTWAIANDPDHEWMLKP